MKVLVTGGAGFIGSHTVDALLQKGHDVRVMDALEPPVHPQREWPAYLAPDAERVVGDVRSRSDWERALQNVNVVFHLAAYQDYLPDFSRFAHVNDTGTALLYEVMVAERLPVQKVVLGSSQAVYGEGKYHCPEHGTRYPQPRTVDQLREGGWGLRCDECDGEMTPSWTDEAVVRPANQYAVSKYAQELYALTLGRLHGIPTVALRYSIVQGPRQSPRNAYSGALRNFSSRLLKGVPPVVYEDGHQLRDYVSVQDVIRANLLVLERPEADYQVFNVGGDRAVSVLDYAHLLCRMVGADWKPVISGEFRVGDVRHILSDVGKLKLLGWRPEVPLERVAEQYLAWLEPQKDHLADPEEAARHMRALGVLRSVR